MSSSSAASRLWTRMSALSRDSFHIGSAFAGEASPIIRRQTTQLSFGDAFRNALVTQARQSNRVATNLLTMQQQIGLMRYHGLLGYWRQRQGALQQAAGTAPTSSGDTAGMSTSASSASSSDEKGNVAQVAFMITASMRKELSENLGYTAEQIKSLTPVDASLILHHALKPEQKDEQLPGLLEAHKAEQERIAQLEKQKQQEQQAREEAKALAAKEAPPVAPSPEQHQNRTEKETERNADLPAVQQKSVAPSQTEPNEGVYKLEDPTSSKPPFTLETPPEQSKETPTASADSMDHDGEARLGSFAKSMEERVKSEQEWFEVVEIRTADKTQVPVGLFSNLEEAEMTVELRNYFSERRAKEELENRDSIPATTYTIQKTIK